MRRVRIEFVVPDDVDNSELLTKAQEFAVQVSEEAGMEEHFEDDPEGYAQAVENIENDVSVEDVGAATE